MSQHVCAWWLGYSLLCPIRRWMEDPEKMLAPYARQGMTVLEPGPGMGFLTLPLARLVGSAGRVVAVDIQAKMLESLQRRAAKAGLLPHIETRLAQPNSLSVGNLKGAVDFVLAFWMVHEMPSAESFFLEAVEALKPGGMLLLAEPKGHVKLEKFDQELTAARAAGLEVVEWPAIRRSMAAILRKT